MNASFMAVLMLHCTGKLCTTTSNTVGQGLGTLMDVYNRDFLPCPSYFQ